MTLSLGGLANGHGLRSRSAALQPSVITSFKSGPAACCAERLCLSAPPAKRDFEELALARCLGKAQPFRKAGRQSRSTAIALLPAFFAIVPTLRAGNYPTPKPGDFVIHNFHFKDGETLPELRLHYLTLGAMARDPRGRVTNAVLILHGTTGSGRQFLSPSFADVLFGPGDLLDASRYFIVLPDNIGHGESSKPSNGLGARFPHYDYDDMVAAQHRLLTDGLGVNHLRLVMGTSMGCMHSFVWGETYPDFMDALMPLACLPVAIAGRNRVWREETMDSIRLDPAWKNGDYTAEPRDGLRSALYILLIATSSPLEWQKQFPTREAADKFLHDFVESRLPRYDANDMLYALDSSRNYDPSPNLEKITAPVMLVNSADDFINPPELGIAEREIRRVRRGKFVLLPITDQTRGHGTHTLARVWKQYLQELLEESR